MNKLKTALAVSIIFSIAPLICMHPKNNDTISFVKKVAKNKGKVPQPLFGKWVSKHNQAMDWVAQQRARLRINGEPLVKYVMHPSEK